MKGVNKKQFQKTYDEIFRNFHKMLEKRKSMQSATFFLCLCAVHLGNEAKTCVGLLQKNNEWEKLPKGLQEFLGTLMALKYNIIETPDKGDLN